MTFAWFMIGIMIGAFFGWHASAIRVYRKWSRYSRKMAEIKRRG